MGRPSKSRKKTKAKRSRPRRTSARVVEMQSPPCPLAGQVDLIELPPDPPPQASSAVVIGPPPDSSAQMETVNVREEPPAPQTTERNLTEPPPEPPRAPSTEECPPGPIKILVVEDGNFLRLGIQRALVRAGYSVVTAADGEAARKSQPDLILLDLLLPKVGGQDVLKTLKHDPATAAISVVVLTGLSQRNAERLVADGALGFLQKSDLGLEKGSEVLLAALSAIVQQLPVLQARKRATAAASR